MTTDAVLIELLSESLNGKSADRRRAARLLLDELQAGAAPEEIVERIGHSERKKSAGCAADAQRLAAQLGIDKRPH